MPRCDDASPQRPTVNPSDEHIIQDFDRIPGAINNKIAAKGGIIEDVTRTGWRKKAHAMPPLHPHAKAALEASEAKFGGSS